MNLKDYLLKLKELETLLYEQNKLYWNLKNQADNMYQNRRVFQKEQYLSEPPFDLSEGGCLNIILGAIALFIILPALLNGQFALFFGLLLLYVPIFLSIPSFIYFKHKREAENANNAIYSRNSKIDQDNKREEELINKKIAVIHNEMDIVSKNYWATKKIADKLYSYNIIYPKYRGLIPICAFYEYFMSGRCNCLEGHEGAYNIYENELRQNIIIGKLDTVINRLDDIKDNQYILYQSINESNSNVQSISQQVLYMSQSLNSISNNSQITAYNSGIAARNSEFLKWMEVYKNA